jgi:hypothetical protein
MKWIGKTKKGNDYQKIFSGNVIAFIKDKKRIIVLHSLYSNQFEYFGKKRSVRCFISEIETKTGSVQGPYSINEYNSASQENIRREWVYPHYGYREVCNSLIEG